MRPAELEQLCTLLESLRHDKRIMESLSVLEQQEIAGASDTICSLIRKRLDGPGRESRSGRGES